MRLENKKRVQAAKQKHTPQNNAHSVSQRRRLTDEEWREVWSGPYAWVWVAGIAALFAAACGVI